VVIGNGEAGGSLTTTGGSPRKKREKEKERSCCSPRKTRIHEVKMKKPILKRMGRRHATKKSSLPKNVKRNAPRTEYAISRLERGRGKGDDSAVNGNSPRSGRRKSISGGGVPT